MLRLLLILLAASVASWSRCASAATVALLQPASDVAALNEALFRLKGELLAVGLSVAVTARPPVRDTASAEGSAWFEATAAERHIDAFMDVLGADAPTGVDIWFCERAPRQLRLARVVLEPGMANAAATLAIRAIEVLRSSFLAVELAGASEARKPPLASPPPPAEQASEPPIASGAPLGRWAFEAGATALTSVGGVGPAILPLVRVEWAVEPWLSLAATGAGFGTRPEAESAAGSVQVAQQFGLFGACLCRAATRGVSPLVALSAGFLHTTVDGHTDAPNVAHHDQNWAFLVDAGAGARLGLSERFYVALAAHAQLTAPYVAVHVLDTVSATLGRPNLLLTLTAGARP